MKGMIHTPTACVVEAEEFQGRRDEQRGACLADVFDHEGLAQQLAERGQPFAPGGERGRRRGLLARRPRRAGGIHAAADAEDFSRSISRIHHRGIPRFAVFQLETVEGVRPSALATATVPPSSSMMSDAVFMGTAITINVI